MSQQLTTPSSDEGDSANTPAESQHSQHDRDLGASETPGHMPGNKQSFSFPRLSILKIQIYDGEKEMTAEDIISKITKQSKERKSTNGGDKSRNKMTDRPINPQVQTSDVQRESEISEGVPNTLKSQSTEGDNNEPGTSQHSVLDPSKADLKTKLTELVLIKSVTDRLNGQESGFRVRLFEFKTYMQCQMLPAIESITEPRQLQSNNQRFSYMIFFYRDVDGPEIFAAVSGMAYRHVDQRSCPEFPKKIARRLLEPKTIELDTRNMTGDTSQVRKQYIPGRGGTINLWDVIDVVVHKYTAKPKKKASILQFCNTWEIKPPSIAITKLSVKVMTKFPSIFVIQEIISHFATIDGGKPTYQFGSSQNVEKDDKTFAMFDFVQEESKKKTINKLTENLNKRISSYFNKESEEYMQLSCDDLDVWLNACEYRLYLDTESKRCPIRTWHEAPPTLTDVIEVLTEKEISANMLSTDVKMSLRKADGNLCRKKPITSFIQSHFTYDSKSYYFWCGKWLKIELEYFQMLDENFKSVIKEQIISSANLMPLPWTCSRAGKTKGTLKTKIFALTSLQDFLTNISLNNEVVLDLKKTKRHLRSVGEVENCGDGKVCCSYQPRDYEHDENQLKPVLQIFVRMNTPLTEGVYNDSYILLDKIISTRGSQTGFLVGDRMLINNIEMFDIIMYNQTHTYIIHVKEGFDNNTRVVASQIRNSADILFRALTGNMTKTVLDEMWDRFTRENTTISGQKSQSTRGKRAKKEGMEKNQRAMKSKLEEMTKEGFMRLFKERGIVYVLAVRDKVKDRSMETGDEMEAQLKETYPEKCEEILQLLEDKRYVQKKHSRHVVTDTFIYVNKANFLKDMMAGLDNQGLGKDLWMKVYAILFEKLLDIKSPIAKLEVLSLFSHFRKYQIDQNKFQLKVCFIKKSIDHFRELKTFLECSQSPC